MQAAARRKLWERPWRTCGQTVTEGGPKDVFCRIRCVTAQGRVAAPRQVIALPRSISARQSPPVPRLEWVYELRCTGVVRVVRTMDYTRSRTDAVVHRSAARLSSSIHRQAAGGKDGGLLLGRYTGTSIRTSVRTLTLLVPPTGYEGRGTAWGPPSTARTRSICMYCTVPPFDEQWGYMAIPELYRRERAKIAIMLSLYFKGDTCILS